MPAVRICIVVGGPPCMTSMFASLAVGHDVGTVIHEGLAGKNEPEVWKGAQLNGRFLITRDLDFSDTRKYVPPSPRRLLPTR
ncbi:MAG: DUF5615 family PIN-like protein, partial [Phycisphaerae bacterium]|nr:DUF5615 family PIN-like protein [Phycisphaerae bacterium]